MFPDGSMLSCFHERTIQRGSRVDAIAGVPSNWCGWSARPDRRPRDVVIRPIVLVVLHLELHVEETVDREETCIRIEASCGQNAVTSSDVREASSTSRFPLP